MIVRDSGPWAEEKLYYLDHYLSIFSVGMKKKWPGKLYYIDLFAGPGKCRIRDTNKEIDGSPLIALKYDFEKYFFFEADPECFDALCKRIEKRAPDKLQKTVIIPGDCNQEIDEVNPPSPPNLGVAFIDPTGLSPLSFDTIRKMTRSRKIDLIINFHEGMGIRMNLHQYLQKEDQSALTTFLGSERSIRKLQETPSSIDQACREIANEYLENLRHLGYLAFDNDKIPVNADRNTLLYYLLFASKHLQGTRFWRNITVIGPHGQRKLPGL